MFRKRDLSPLPQKRRLEQSLMCARPQLEGQGTVSLSPQNIDHAARREPWRKADSFKAKQ